MSVQTRPLTYDDLRGMPDDGRRYELISGELYVAPAPNRAHQDVAYLLTRLLGDKVDAEKLGRVRFAPVDVRLSATDVVQPDLLFIRRDRLHIYHQRGDVEGPPDLVVEIVSPSSEKIDPGRKFDLYAASRVAEYWLVDPAARALQIFVLRNGKYVEVATEEGRLRSEVIPGLEFEPTTIFAVLDEE